MFVYVNILFVCVSEIDVYSADSVVVGIVSTKMSSLSLCHGVRVIPQPNTTVEQVLLAIGEQVGYSNITFASQMHKGVVVFMK